MSSHPNRPRTFTEYFKGKGASKVQPRNRDVRTLLFTFLTTKAVTIVCQQSLIREDSSLAPAATSPSNLTNSYCLQARKIEQLEADKMQLQLEKQNLEDRNQLLATEKDALENDLFQKEKECEELLAKLEIIELESKELHHILENKQVDDCASDKLAS